MELLQVTNSANLLMLMRLLTRTMKETDDDESDGNRNELMTTMMRTKRMMRMMRMMGMMMRMMRMLRMRMKMKMRMVIMMRRAVVGLENLLSQQAKTPQCSNRFPPSVVSKRNLISKKNAPQMEARICIKMFETMQHM